MAPTVEPRIRTRVVSLQWLGSGDFSSQGVVECGVQKERRREPCLFLFFFHGISCEFSISVYASSGCFWLLWERIPTSLGLVRVGSFLPWFPLRWRWWAVRVYLHDIQTDCFSTKISRGYTSFFPLSLSLKELDTCAVTG